MPPTIPFRWLSAQQSGQAKHGPTALPRQLLSQGIASELPSFLQAPFGCAFEDAFGYAVDDAQVLCCPSPHLCCCLQEGQHAERQALTLEEVL